MAVSGEKRPPRPAPASGGMAKKLILALFVSVSALVYRQIQPPPPKIPGSPGGPPVTANRTRLSDGRYLAYLESGVPKEKAKYKIIFVHGFDSCRYDALPISTELAQKLGIYLLSFDRPGYAESDPHPGRTEKSIALDIAELADNLQLGPRFHLAGFSMGGEIMWSCLKYIPHRLSGVAILGPVGNYWWPGLPSDVSWEAWYQQLPQDQWAVWVSHHLPWLTYWWNSQKLFPASSVIAYNPALLLLFAWAACTLPTSCSCVLLAWAACAAGLLLPWPIAGLQLLGLHSCCPARGPAGSPACRTPAALGRTPRAVRWAVRVARAGCWASRSTHAAAALRCAAPARTPVPPTPAHRRQERTNTKNS